MNPYQEFRQGIDLGILTREFFAELRVNNIDPWDTMNPDSIYYKRSYQIQREKEKLSGAGYFGMVVGQLMNLEEWCQNSEYLYGSERYPGETFKRYLIRMILKNIGISRN